MRKSGKTLLQSSVAGDGCEKVRFDVLMKTCNILSKIMVILQIYGMKVLTIFTVEYHTIFFEFTLNLNTEPILSVLYVYIGFYTFFASKQCRVRWEKWENDSFLICE